MQCQNNKNKDVLALFNFRSKVNVKTPAYVAQLGLKLQKTDFEFQKIDRSWLEIYGMIIATF